MYLIFDTETTGLPINFNSSFFDVDNWPRVVQLAWQVHDIRGILVKNKSYIIYPDNFDIPYNAVKIHGINNEEAKKNGIKIKIVLKEFNSDLHQSKVLIGHNLNFDLNALGAEFVRLNFKTELFNKKNIDTQNIGQFVCKIPTGRLGKYKYPKLSELYTFLFNEMFDQAHNAISDVNATARCFFELLRKEYISFDEVLMKEYEKKNFKKNFSSTIPVFKILIQKKNQKHNKNNINLDNQKYVIKVNNLDTKYYFPFHNHTIFSTLQSTTKISELVQFADEQKFPAVGICDYGNLMGAYIFINEVKKMNEKNNRNINYNASNRFMMPIIGIEVYISDDYKNKKFTKDNPDKRYTQVLLAKNKIGYKNLCKISTIGYVEGMYMNFPRVGKEIISHYRNNLIATTGSLESKISYLILNHGISYAEKEFLWWKNLFNEDYYVQIQNHNSSEEDHVNKILLYFAKKYEVKILIQNSTNYLRKEEFDTQDIALCIKSNSLKSSPIGKGGFNSRLGMISNEFYLQDRYQFSDKFINFIDEIKNYKNFLDKFSFYDLDQKVLLPKFEIPIFLKQQSSFDNSISKKNKDENSYLKYLAYQGAKEKYIKITELIQERLDLELNTIKNIGYPGYFLIVQDFTNEARKIGVVVGPGRGSVAGSLVAYCIGITNIDPIKYDLLFERFLNPDRISLPDIDIDFDVRGREKIIDYVVNKYGKNKVAQIITYNKLAGRSAIRDTARVLNLPIFEASILAKKLPSNLSLRQIKLLNKKEISRLVRSEELEGVFFLKDLMEKKNNLKSQVIEEALKLEGCIRNTGVHACGIIITIKNITDLIPVTVAKEAKLLVSQFDSSVVEKIGLLKMDFLGLKNLTIIQDTINLVKKRQGIQINTDNIPITDFKTFELFQRGETVGVFQFESLGMQKYLKALKPDKFDDLIAMNALYRPGPIKYISNFINRKHNIEPITYDLPEMEKYLKSTYGITIYQEQVMLLSQKLANFSKGDADILRKAMGKKQRVMLDKMKDQFINNGKKNNHSELVLDKIWRDWETFAEYAFNKSHSTCYSLIAFHTAYLKANYPSEYMAALLSNNLNQINTSSYFIEEARKMGIKVLGPNLNESDYRFIADNNGNIRFGLGAIKNIGKNTIQFIILERKKNGKFINLFDFLERINILCINKKILENLVLSGALDELDSYHRSQYFQKDFSGTLMIEKLIRYCHQYHQSKNFYQTSLFDNMNENFKIKKPMIPECNKWSDIKQLQEEKKTIGIYISSHPLDKFKYEIEFLKPINLIDIENKKNDFLGKKIIIIGMILKIEEGTSLNGGKKFATLYLEDTTKVMSFKIFGEEYLKYKNIFLIENEFIGLEILLKQSKEKQYIYLNIISIFFLNDVFKKRVKKIIFYINLHQIDIFLIESLNLYFNQNQGNQSFIMIIKDKNLELSLYSSKKKIKISKKFLEFVKEKKLNFYLS